MLFQKVYTFEFLITFSCNGIEHFDSKVSPPEIFNAISIPVINVLFCIFASTDQYQSKLWQPFLGSQCRAGWDCSSPLHGGIESEATCEGNKVQVVTLRAADSVIYNEPQNKNAKKRK